MKVLIATDSFPPDCGGSGWSTYELARGLRRQGHAVTVVHVRPGRPDGSGKYDGFAVREVGVANPSVPFVRNYIKSERLGRRLAAILAAAAKEVQADVVHGQHVLTVPAAVAAAAAVGVPSVATVRDYWPVCYWSDLITDPNADALCPACSARGMRACVRGRGGPAWPLALPMIPYMRANLARKQRALSAATRVIAVSSTIAADLLGRAAGIDAARLATIPNPVDADSIRETAERHRVRDAGPFAIYVGKLAPNKGSRHLVTAVERAALRLPLVVVGDGPDRAGLERWARETGRDVRFEGWLPRERALGWLAAASVLVFPSQGPESLSRVLLEASALGLPIAAMDTGGTRDIIEPGRTGLLSRDASGLGDDVSRLIASPDEAAAFGRAAREHVDARFAAGRVVERIVEVYRDAGAARG